MDEFNEFNEFNDLEFEKLAKSLKEYFENKDDLVKDMRDGAVGGLLPGASNAFKNHNTHVNTMVDEGIRLNTIITAPSTKMNQLKDTFGGLEEFMKHDMTVINNYDPTESLVHERFMKLKDRNPDIIRTATELYERAKQRIIDAPDISARDKKKALSQIKLSIPPASPMDVVKVSLKKEIAEDIVKNYMKNRSLQVKLQDALRLYGKPIAIFAGLGALTPVATRLISAGVDKVKGIVLDKKDKDDIMKAAAEFLLSELNTMEKLAAEEDVINQIIEG